MGFSLVSAVAPTALSVQRAFERLAWFFNLLTLFLPLFGCLDICAFDGRGLDRNENSERSNRMSMSCYKNRLQNKRAPLSRSPFHPLKRPAARPAARSPCSRPASPQIPILFRTVSLSARLRSSFSASLESPSAMPTSWGRYSTGTLRASPMTFPAGP